MSTDALPLGDGWVGPFWFSVCACCVGGRGWRRPCVVAVVAGCQRDGGDQGAFDSCEQDERWLAGGEGEQRHVDRHVVSLAATCSVRCADNPSGEHRDGRTIRRASASVRRDPSTSARNSTSTRQRDALWTELTAARRGSFPALVRDRERDGRNDPDESQCGPHQDQPPTTLFRPALGGERLGDPLLA
jgi:hypothetical protein